MNRPGQGFTLIELMVTVAVAAILLTVGVPSFRATVENNRLTTAANELVGALNLARSEAIKRGVRVTVCKSNAAADDCGDATTTWSDGWIIFSDLDGDGILEDDGDSIPCEPNEDDCLLRVYPPVNGGMDISNSHNRVTFTPNGLALGFNGTFTFCDDRGANHARGVILSPTGRVRMAVDGSDADQIPEDDWGNNLSCS